MTTTTWLRASNSSSGFTPFAKVVARQDVVHNDNDDDDDVFLETLILAGVVLCALMGLVFLRFCTNFLIDVFVLDEYPAVYQFLCPPWMCCRFCRRRRRQSMDSVDQEQQQQAELEEGAVSSHPEEIRPNTSSCGLDSLPLAWRNEALDEVLESRILTAHDIAILNKHHPRCSRDDAELVNADDDADENCEYETIPPPATNNDHGSPSALRCYPVVLCSICLSNLQPGDCIATTRHCSHTFHKTCIVSWVGAGGGTSNNCCPYCRTPLVTDQQVEKFLEVKQKQSAVSTTTSSSSTTTDEEEEAGENNGQ